MDLETHRLLARWAADCAERVLALFEEEAVDDRPRRAIETARAWARGEVRVGAGQKAAVAAHAATREVREKGAVAAARAAGHAAATAHAGDHCMGSAHYAVRALAARGVAAREEREWQMAWLPKGVREWVAEGMQAKGI